MCKIMLTLRLGIYVQRIGDRNNDIALNAEDRYVFLDMFYVLNNIT